MDRNSLTSTTKHLVSITRRRIRIVVPLKGVLLGNAFRLIVVSSGLMAVIGWLVASVVLTRSPELLEAPRSLAVAQTVPSERLFTEDVTRQPLEKEQSSRHWYSSETAPSWALVAVGTITFVLVGWQAWATQRYVSISAAVMRETGKAAKAAERSADAAANSLLVSDRPWVQVEVAINGPLEVGGGTIALPVTLNLTNHGNSVAQHIDTRVILTTQPYQSMRTDALQRLIMHRLGERLADQHPVMAALVLFPRQSAVKHLTAFAKVDAIRAELNEWGPTILDNRPLHETTLHLMLVGMVGYTQHTIQPGAKVPPLRTTHFGYRVTHVYGSPICCRSYAQSDLRLQDSEFGPNDAA